MTQPESELVEALWIALIAVAMCAGFILGVTWLFAHW